MPSAISKRFTSQICRSLLPQSTPDIMQRTLADIHRMTGVLSRGCSQGTAFTRASPRQERLHTPQAGNTGAAGGRDSETAFIKTHLSSGLAGTHDSRTSAGAASGGGRSCEFSRRILANSILDTATSAIGRQRSGTWLTSLVPILISFSSLATSH